MWRTVRHNSIQLLVTPQTANLSQTMRPIALVARYMRLDTRCHLTEKMWWCRMFPGSVWSGMMSYSPVCCTVSAIMKTQLPKT